MICKICNHKAEYLFSSLVLCKYHVKYFRCNSCYFIQTEEPYWLAEAYQSAITDLDVGLVNRNLEYSKIIYNVITGLLDFHKQFLDYAGGYGLFVRMMRDRGLDYYNYDKYCENIFAKNYEIKSLNNKEIFEAVTALEIFEHLEDPIREIKSLLLLSNVIIFSTEIVPDRKITSATDWWYFVPETGQHIAFYAHETMLHIAKSLKLNYYNRGSIHIFSTKNFPNDPFDNNIFVETPSLIEEDFEMAKSILKSKDLPNLANDFSVTKKDTNNFDNSIYLINTIRNQNKKIKDIVNKSSKKIKTIETEINTIRKEKTQLKKSLEIIYRSRYWKFIKIYYKFRDKLILLTKSTSESLYNTKVRLSLSSEKRKRKTNKNK